MHAGIQLLVIDMGIIVIASGLQEITFIIKWWWGGGGAYDVWKVGNCSIETFFKSVFENRMLVFALDKHK